MSNSTTEDQVNVLAGQLARFDRELSRVYAELHRGRQPYRDASPNEIADACIQEIKDARVCDSYDVNREVQIRQMVDRLVPDHQTLPGDPVPLGILLQAVDELEELTNQMEHVRKLYDESVDAPEQDGPGLWLGFAANYKSRPSEHPEEVAPVIAYCVDNVMLSGQYLDGDEMFSPAAIDDSFMEHDFPGYRWVTADKALQVLCEIAVLSPAHRQQGEQG